MVDLAVLDSNMDEIIEPRTAPDGEYIALTTGVEFDKIPNAKETPYADVEFKLVEPLNGQDLTGVNLNRPVTGRIWLSKDALGQAKRQLKSFGIDTAGEKLRDSFDKIVGTTVVVKVVRDSYQAKKGRDVASVYEWRPA